MMLIDIEPILDAAKLAGKEYVSIDFLKGFEQVDAVPVVRGEWIQKHHIISLDNMTLTGTYPTCSLCGYAWLGVAKNTNYCPNCAALLALGRKDGK